MTTGFFELGDGKLYYEDSGGRPDQAPVVLNHAGFLDSRMWDDQWEAFAQHYRVIRYDMLGYGKSDPVRGPRTRRQDLYQLLRRLRIGRAHLLGCSAGGAIVLDLALEHPELAASLVLVNSVPGGFEFQGEPPQELFEMFAAMAAGEVDRASELQLRLWVDGPQRLPDQVDAEVRRRAGAMNRPFVASRTWLLAEMAPSDPLDPPAATRLREVQVPTLIVTGALDHAENRRAADFMVASIAGASLFSIPETAHVPNLEAPSSFNRAVLEFLAAVEAKRLAAAKPSA